MRAKTSSIAALLLVLVACSGGGEPEDQAEGPIGPGDPRAALTPEFEPEAATDVSTAGTAPADTSVETSAVSTTATSARAGSVGGSAWITDPEGDVSLSVEPPPPWADLTGATLTLADGQFELRVSLGGGDAPETTDANHTMNVASFYDIDGDGQVDYEIWLNLASGGWDAGHFTPDGARYQEEAGVEITTDGGEVVARFPHAHLAGGVAFRWSIASEWGRYETLGTNLAARDDMPDDDEPAHFPA